VIFLLSGGETMVNKSETITVKMPSNLKKLLVNTAEKLEVKMNYLVVAAIASYLSKEIEVTMLTQDRISLERLLQDLQQVNLGLPEEIKFDYEK
jgi:hypothetical protein